MTGVLLSHGYSGRSASMQPWADHLTGLGYDVVAPTLPGHSDTWREMERTTFDDWFSALLSHFDDLRSRHEQVFVGGLSMGGSLALRLASERSDQVAGVMLVNPVGKIEARGAWLAPLLKYVVRSVASAPPDIKKPGVVEPTLERTSTRAAHTVLRGISALPGQLPSVRAPIVLFRSPEDHMVSDASHELILSRVSSTDVTVHLLPESYHVATLDNDAATIHQESAAFLARLVRPSA